MSTVLIAQGQIGSAKHALKFLLAGNATVTFKSLKSGSRFTYRVKRIHCDACKADLGNYGRKDVKCKDCPCHEEAGKYFVSVLNGPDNTRDYQYMGMLVPGGVTGGTQINEGAYTFIATRGSRVTLEAPSAVAFVWVFAQLQADKLSDDIEIWHAGKCGRCGRKLTVPESIALGIGPECLSQGF